jgi:hypothetical protein
MVTRFPNPRNVVIKERENKNEFLIIIAMGLQFTLMCQFMSDDLSNSKFSGQCACIGLIKQCCFAVGD